MRFNKKLAASGLLTANCCTNEVARTDLVVHVNEVKPLVELEFNAVG